MNQSNDSNTCHLTVLGNQDFLIDELQKELSKKDVSNNFSSLTATMIEVLEESKLNREALFPNNSSYDSIVLFAFKNEQVEDHFNNPPRRIRRLSKKEFQKLENLLNNPLNFHWAECGTQLEEFFFIFYDNNKSIAKTIISCDSKSVECIPRNHLSRFGGLNKNGQDCLKSIISNE